MRCPTCGRGVRKGQDTCSFCGAFVANAYLGKAGGGLIAPPDLPRMTTAQPKTAPPEFPMPSGDPHRPASPSLPDLDDLDDLGPEQEPQAHRPEPTPPQRQQQPKYAGLLRILFPLIFILIPLFNLLVRNSPLSFGEKPAMQETQFYENVAAGQFSGPQMVFSLSQHERVVLVARWTGPRGRHEYAFRWHTPDGNVLPNTSTVVRFQLGGDDGFSAYSVLPLKPGLPLGTWRVEVAVDSEVQAQPTFELRE
jgi:hypothetical protein